MARLPFRAGPEQESGCPIQPTPLQGYKLTSYGPRTLMRVGRQDMTASQRNYLHTISGILTTSTMLYPANPTPFRGDTPLNTSADPSREPLHWSSLPRTLQILIIGLVIASALLLIWASWRLSHQTHDNGWMPLMFLALGALPFSLPLPTVESVVFMGETYLMSIAVLYGAPTCTLAAGACALALAFLLFRGADLLMRLHSFGSMVCGAFLYSTA